MFFSTYLINKDFVFVGDVKNSSFISGVDFSDLLFVSDFDFLNS